ncbi:hypothetical protein OIO90_000147 [Microbotryomycetes sp. JL221]|nr:hypothetical protein OIO90_000147 [Microbotryomycetes sp. JL221]
MSDCICRSDSSTTSSLDLGSSSPPTTAASSCQQSDADCQDTDSLNSNTCNDHQVYGTARDNLDKVVQQLIRDKESNQTLLRAWSERCRTLEDEVRRLVLVCTDLERSREAHAHKSHQHGKIDNQIGGALVGQAPTIGAKASCEWNGREWQPIEQSTSKQVVKQIPRIDPTKSMSVPRCKFSHAYELTTDQVEEMRRGAKFHICNATRNGLECLDPTCVYGHECVRKTACPRVNCPFNDQQHLPSSTSTPRVKSPLPPSPRRRDTSMRS